MFVDPPIYFGKVPSGFQSSSMEGTLGVVGGLPKCDMTSMHRVEMRTLLYHISVKQKAAILHFKSVKNTFLKFQEMRHLSKLTSSLCNVTFSTLVCWTLFHLSAPMEGYPQSALREQSI